MHHAVKEKRTVKTFEKKAHGAEGSRAPHFVGWGRLGEEMVLSLMEEWETARLRYVGEGQIRAPSRGVFCIEQTGRMRA